MKILHRKIEDIISEVPEVAWRAELEKTTVKYHTVAAWAAIIFDPVFAITDYYNIPANWKIIFSIRILVSVLTLATLLWHKKRNTSSYTIVIVPFVLISLQNAFTYMYIGPDDLLGHNLNYIALFIGAAMFLAWESAYSIFAIIISVLASAFFINANPSITVDGFFVNGGLLLMTVAIFMYMLIRTRYALTVKEIKARLALQISNQEIYHQNQAIQSQSEEIQAQAEKIRGINDNLELLVEQRTRDLEAKNKALQEYAFINAHKLRSPVASILGLVNIVHKTSLDHEGKVIFDHLKQSAEQLDNIVSSIRQTIEKADF